MIRLIDRIEPYVKRQYTTSIAIRLAQPDDRERIIRLIDTVAGERRYLQTDHFHSTSIWEQALREGANIRDGLLLLLTETRGRAVGYARLTTDWDHPQKRFAGNIGIALLSPYRSQGIGTALLHELIEFAPRFGFQTLTAHILATNTRSLCLFRRFDFAPASTRNIYLAFAGCETQEITVELALPQEK